MSSIQAFVPAKIVQTFAAFLEFCYIARRNIISEDSLKQLDSALHRFHEAHQFFSGTVHADGPSAFSLPRQHAMVHYHDHIQNFGSPNGLCSSITESKHITAVKRPWRWSNKHLALPQILRCNQRLNKLAAARVDFTTRGMLTDSCLIQAIKEATMDCDSEDPIDEAGSDADSDADSDTSDEIWLFDTDRTSTSVQDLSIAGAHTSNVDDECPCTPRSPSPTLPINEDDEDCGPIESGPLMNEVRLVGMRGQCFLSCIMPRCLIHP